VCGRIVCKIVGRGICGDRIEEDEEVDEEERCLLDLDVNPEGEYIDSIRSLTCLSPSLCSHHIVKLLQNSSKHLAPPPYRLYIIDSPRRILKSRKIHSGRDSNT